MQRKIIAMVSCGLVLAGCDPAPPAHDTPDPQATATASPAPSASPAPRSVQARWWEWAGAEPEATNPVADSTGKDCARNQPGDVWFLAGTFGGRVARRCTVPAGLPLVVPALNRIGGDVDECADFMAGATGSVKFDGAPVAVDHIDHEPITFTAGRDNPVTGTAGVTSGEGCGLWARVEAPSPGKHTVVVHGASGDFQVDAEYTLVVTGASASAG